jgi:dTMP kinase
VAGLFITFEGVEGCGKSTQIDLLEIWLRGQGRSSVKVHEPGGTDVGDRLRQVLLDPELESMMPTSEALLYLASRAQLVNEVIKPGLEADRVVLCDRYVDSTLAYQVFARGLDLMTVMSINDWVTEGLLPDLTIYLRIPAELSLKRTIGRDLDRLEQEGLDFHRLVEAGYEELAVKFAERFVLIDGLEPIDEVHRHVVAAIQKLL